MNAIFRTLAGIALGLVVALALLIAVEIFGSIVHPVPDDFKETMEEMCLHVERFPAWVLAVAAAAWAITAFASTKVARRFGNLVAAAVIGLLLIGALVLNLSMLPYPIWFKAATVIAIPVAVFSGARNAGAPPVSA